MNGFALYTRHSFYYRHRYGRVAWVISMAKSILITGASSGLGEGMAREFARRGYRVALTGRRIDRLEVLQKELQAIAPQVIVKVLDVTQYDSVQPTLEAIADELGGLDIVVANSGVGQFFPVGSDHFTDICTTIDTNITGAVATIDAAVRIFQRQEAGHIVGISSVSAIRGLPGQGIYSASKAAVSRYLESLRLEVFGSNIIVTELAPGFIDTDMNRGLASRPFVIPLEKGARILADKIESRINFSYVPAWPWALIARLIRFLPNKFLVERN